ncbi:hypothetical protein [Absidia glauca]|uniref:Uncharacterized protein n=1 Tax=Absidia glauca TaxID=4829 RepID=A0A168NKA1_ABSGL|nr:hypothetical protein [Absidia glauca]
MEIQQLQAYDYDRNEFVVHEDSIRSRFPSIQRALNAGTFAWHPLIQDQVLRPRSPQIFLYIEQRQAKFENIGNSDTSNSEASRHHVHPGLPPQLSISDPITGNGSGSSRSRTAHATSGGVCSSANCLPV